MKQKLALFISAALTAFALVIVGGVITNVRGASKVQPTPVATEEAVVATPTLDASIQDAINQREQAYQDLIAQANARLAEAQQNELALKAQLEALQNANTAAAGAAAPTAANLAPEDAATIAAQYMGRVDLYSVETTILSGNTVYKVVFSSGDIVYLSLDGQILGVAPAPLAAGPSGGSGGSSGHSGGGGHESGEHEGGGGDD
jgi:hypothetical protein